MWRYFELLSLKSNEELDALKQSVQQGANPRDVKMELARELIARYHGEEAAANAHKSAGNQLADGELPDEQYPETQNDEGADQAPIAAVLNRSGLTKTVPRRKTCLRKREYKVDGDVVAQDTMLARMAHTLYRQARNVTVV